MFDLSKALSSKSPSTTVTKTGNSNGIASAALYYQSQECFDLVTEVFRFEGWDEPDALRRSVKDSKINPKQVQQIVILELTESHNVVEEAREFASKVPTHKGVVVIGKEDAISTLRALKDMGFYYVFWPVNKQEFADFLMHVNRNLQTFSGVSEKRKAKRVGMVGVKGGVGTSFISAELCSYLAGQQTDTILVDHQYNNTNLDILFAIREFQPRSVDEFTAPLHEMDESGALSYIYEVRKNLRLLAISGDMPAENIFNYNQTLCELLSRNTNFIVEDFSGSVDFKVEAQMLVDTFDVLVVVFEPSVSSIRSARKLRERIESIQLTLSKKTRLLLVANYHRPPTSFVIKSDEMKKYLGAEVDLEFAYSKNLAHIVIDGKQAHKHDRAIATSVDKLARLINGNSIEESKLPKWFGLGKKKK
ncbi:MULTISPECIES: chromosome partitioning protein ParA [unclassified Vibrio]|uniref:CpaE family protein n=1 Tax=Vibrio sp. HB236076 TaxID=3232307 RepID=A0AB39HKU5_9VIBR|nr:chromosome partitioning protein ParA [Vibrio sp. HB161653]MDP5253174.1 chromosome partitioning protein ParA [Vibrio sp. HB161653]